MQSWVSVWFCSCSCFWPGSQWGAGLDATLIGPVTRVVAVTSATVRVVQCNWLKSYGGSGVYLLVYLHPIPLHKLCPIEVLFGCECSIWFLKLLKLESLVSKLGQAARGALYSSSPPIPMAIPIHSQPVSISGPIRMRYANWIRWLKIYATSRRPREKQQEQSGDICLGAGHIGDLRWLLVCVFGQCTWTQSDIDRVAAATAPATACKTGNWKMATGSFGRRATEKFMLCFALAIHGTSILVNFSCTTGRWNMKWIWIWTLDSRFSILDSLRNHSTQPRRNAQNNQTESFSNPTPWVDI